MNIEIIVKYCIESLPWQGCAEENIIEYPYNRLTLQLTNSHVVGNCFSNNL